MSQTSKKTISILRILLVLLAFSCCLHTPALAQFSGDDFDGDSPLNGVPTAPATNQEVPQHVLKLGDGSGAKQWSVNNYGKDMTAGGCIFNNDPDLYEKWADADSVWIQPPGTVKPWYFQEEVRKPIIESENLFGDAGCPVFVFPDQIQANGEPRIEPLKACKGFYEMIAYAQASEQAMKEGADTNVGPADLDPAIACCHTDYGADRYRCYKKTRSGQRAIQQEVNARAAKANVTVKGMPVEWVKKMDEKKKEKRNAIQQCWDKKYEKVQEYFKGRQLAVCIRSMKNFIKLKKEDLVKAVVSKTKDQATDTVRQTNMPTGGVAISPGTVPGSIVGGTIYAVTGAARLATTVARIAGVAEILLTKCASIATNFGDVDGLLKNLSDQLCEATLGLIERQITSCISIRLAGNILAMPQFNLLTQCPFRFNLNMYISPSGFNCSVSASDQNVIAGAGAGVNGQGINYNGQGSTMTNVSGLVEGVFNGTGCFKRARTLNGSGGMEIRRNAMGVPENAPTSTVPDLPGMVCGNLNPDVVDAVDGIQYLPPGPAPAGLAGGWSVGPIQDTGFNRPMPAFAQTVSRCDLYGNGRIQRTVYVFGDGTTCNSTADGFKSGDFETMTSCYPNGGYKPVERSPIPEACMYRQGNPQPCLLADLSSIDPNASGWPATAANNGNSGGPGSVPVTINNQGQLTSIVASNSVNTVMPNGNVLSTGNILSTTPLANFSKQPSQSVTLTYSNNGLTLAPTVQQLGPQAQGGGNNLIAQELEMMPIRQGDVLELATSQDDCTRAFATHDQINDVAVPRLYPLSTPIVLADGTQQVTGQCSDFGTMSADPTCCDPQSQDCRKPPLSSAPICACDQGNSLTRVIRAKDASGNVLYEKRRDNSGTPLDTSDDVEVDDTSKPIFVCVDKDNKLIPGAKKTCCDAKANGEGAEGCGSPHGVKVNGQDPGPNAQALIGAIQLRARDQADGFDWESEEEPDVKLERCGDEVAMCIPENGAEVEKVKKVKPSPYTYLILRPDSYVTALNGKKTQCCSSKWCNVCPQAYAGAYGLALLETGDQNATPYRRGEVLGLNRDGYLSARPSMTVSPYVSSAELRESATASDTALLEQEWDWNMSLFRDGWPFTEMSFGGGELGAAGIGMTGSGNYNGVWVSGGKGVVTGWGAWLPISSIGRLEGWSNFYTAFMASSSRYNASVRGGINRCFNPTPNSGAAPCTFPGVVISAGEMPKTMMDACNEAGAGTYSSWEILRRRYTSGNFGGSNVVGGFMNTWMNGHNPAGIPCEGCNGAVFGNAWWSWGPASNFEGFNSPNRRLITTYETGGSRGVLTSIRNLSDGSAGVSGLVKSEVPDPALMPLDMLNIAAAAMTVAGQEPVEIKLCDQALPLCRDPKLNDYGDSNPFDGNGSGGLGAGNGLGFSPAGGNGAGSGSLPGTGDGTGGPGIPPQCIGLTGDALQACIEQYGGGGSGTGQLCADLIDDPVAYAQCLADNGFGNGNIPPECQGLTGAALIACIFEHSGAGGGGGLGTGGVRDGGLTNQGGMYSPADGSGGGTGTGGTGTTGGPVRPQTGSGTGIPVPGNGNTGGGGTTTPTTPTVPTTPTTGGGTTPGPATGGPVVVGPDPTEGLF